MVNAYTGTHSCVPLDLPRKHFASLSSDCAGVRELCEANGLTEKSFVRESHQLSSLDLFMSGLRDSACLRHFGGLTAICFINVPNLTSLSGLDKCCPGKYRIDVSRLGESLAAFFAGG